ncbi:MAG: class I SAM-dependent methyltransferase [Proteobacteria bacterium]|nr:class I SAM-dependent methyltransferase [Pseudomonadota bacterium]
MTTGASDRAFAGSIPRLYERYLVPLIFEPYARDLASRVAALAPASVLEWAAGTGVVTRHLAAQLPTATTIVATDLNPAMLEHAQSVGTQRAVTWQQADAMHLPFAEATFDVVVCQFGVMFLPDKAAMFAESRRVLRPGGTLLCNVWDRIEDNVFADCVTEAMVPLFPGDPPRFLARTPHGWHDVRAIEAALVAGGFTGARAIETLAFDSRADSPRDVAIAYCQGTPLRNELEARDPAGLDRATDVAEAALANRFGRGAIAGKIQAHVVSARRPAS